MSLRELSGKRVFVDHTLEGQRHGMAALLDRVHCQLVDSATDNVDVVVSKSIVPKQMPQTSLWCALLRGAFVVPPDTFKYFNLDGIVPATKYSTLRQCRSGGECSSLQSFEPSTGVLPIS